MIASLATAMCSRPQVGIWYLRGFADAYEAHWAVIPSGPAGDEYMKGYALGVARVREEFFAALTALAAHRVSVPAESCCE